MELLATRRWEGGEDGWFAELAVAGVAQWLTLERGSLAIPPGRYRVLMTPSERAMAGTLWSPRPDHALPLLADVPHRDGIRIHAGNHSSDVVGRIPVGKHRDGDATAARPAALGALMAKIGLGPPAG